MAGRREERERLRSERLAAERREAHEARRRLIAGYVVAGLLTLAVVAGIVVVIASGGGSEDSGSDADPNAHIEPDSGVTNGFQPDDREGTEPPAVAQADLEKAARAAGCKLELDLPDEGNGHLQPSDDPPKYKTEPPTSGDHIDIGLQQADGAYAEPVDPVYWVHSIEHGRVAIQYSPDLPEDEQLELKGIFDESPAGMLLFPNPEMPYEVAASAWTDLIGCKSYEGAATLDAIRAFRDVYRGQGPENFPISL